ncbi:MAG: phosphate--acyl-ACP acyltransferase, partial [Nitrospirae bacterium]
MKELVRSHWGRLSFWLLARPLMRLRQRTDYAEFGGAPLLGVNGVCMICHGRSSAKAIKNAILRAKSLVEVGVIERIQRDIEGTLSHAVPARA